MFYTRSKIILDYICRVSGMKTNNPKLDTFAKYRNVQNVNAQ